MQTLCHLPEDLHFFVFNYHIIKLANYHICIWYCRSNNNHGVSYIN
jgi:hypothetical protein